MKRIIKMIIALWPFYAVVLVIVGLFWALSQKPAINETYIPPPALAAVAIKAEEPEINKYTKQQVNSAQKVMTNVKQLANVFVDGSSLVVEFNNYLFPYDINKRLDFVRAVADADAVINGKPRSIYFYDPGNKQIAKADTLNGVRLK